MKKAKICLTVDGNFSGSVEEVAKHCNLVRASLYAALSHNQKTFKGYIIKKLENNQFLLETKESKLDFSAPKVANVHKSAVPVKCLETNTIYPSINAAAKACKEHMWTMSVKMEETGKFVDRQGNTYIRLAPMIKRTNRTYGVKSSEITRDIKPYTKKSGISMFKCDAEPSKEIKVEETKFVPNDKEVIVNNLVKSATLLTANKNYNEAAQVLTILSNFDK